jgi:nitroreductase
MLGIAAAAVEGTDRYPEKMSRHDAADRIRPLVRTRQTREFADEPVDAAALDAIADAARWSGSSRNGQPWRFIVVTDRDSLRSLAEAGMPQTRALANAAAAIAIVLPLAPGTGISHAYDEGRAAERILVAASLLGLGAGIAWVRSEARPAVGELLGVPEDRYVRTLVAIGHPTDAGRRPKSAPGEARLPREATVFHERWPD